MTLPFIVYSYISPGLKIYFYPWPEFTKVIFIIHLICYSFVNILYEM